MRAFSEVSLSLKYVQRKAKDNTHTKYTAASISLHDKNVVSDLWNKGEGLLSEQIHIFTCTYNSITGGGRNNCLQKDQISGQLGRVKMALQKGPENSCQISVTTLNTLLGVFLVEMIPERPPKGCRVLKVY